MFIYIYCKRDSLGKQKNLPESSVLVEFLKVLCCCDLNKIQAVYLSPHVSWHTGEYLMFCRGDNVASMYIFNCQNKRGRVSTQLQNNKMKP